MAYLGAAVLGVAALGTAVLGVAVVGILVLGVAVLGTAVLHTRFPVTDMTRRSAMRRDYTGFIGEYSQKAAMHR